MVEPVQGEGGIVLPPAGFLQGLRQLADDHDLILVFDEVQSGCGRTGEWFAYQHFGVVPDIMTLAKALCGGIAGGAMLAKPEVAVSLRPGMHAATYGGNPLAARAGIAYLETIEQEDLLAHGRHIGEVFRQRLVQLQNECPLVRDVRVLGVMVGVQLSIDGTAIVQRCMEKQLLVNCTQGTVVRLLPALNLTEEQVHNGCDILAEVIKSAEV
jgi:acetylornithine/succinyldiaminopimelate/putrescine aminotransferase